ncbi:MAG: sensor domain-containing diguanylate cyclase [Lachnospiraceae bacterium]|nr:sensor domain-containing diguanylate cyclase [Lachnospiraceae bacterium]
MTRNKAAVVTAFLVSFMLLATVYILLLQRDVDMERERYNYIAHNEADHISSTIDRVMTRITTLKAMIQDHDGNTDFFDEVADEIYNSVTEETGIVLKNLAVAPDGVVTKAYPLEGNESLIGFNFLDLSKPGNMEAKMAYEKGETILTNPFPLVQGGMGMAGRTPVFIDVDGEKHLWGLVTVTMDYENLIEYLNLDRLSAMGMEYQLSYFDDTNTNHIMVGVSEIADDAVFVEFAVRNLTWYLVISPAEGWFSNNRSMFVIGILLVLSIFVGLITNMFFKLREKNEMLTTISIKDKLTGCYNRRAYEEQLAKYADGGMKDDFVYVAVDVNGLKRTNDTLGHTAGDELICSSVSCLKECFGNYGEFYRTGGDEFIGLLSISEEDLEKAKQKFEETMKNKKGLLVEEVSMSVGYTARREFPEASITEIAKIADKRMYDAKRKYYEKHDRRSRR